MWNIFAGAVHSGHFNGEKRIGVLLRVQFLCCANINLKLLSDL